MALIDETKYRIHGPQSRRIYHYLIDGSSMYREEKEFLVEWHCDDTGGESTHEGTFASMFISSGEDPYELVTYGPDVSYGKNYGWYRERYLQRGQGWVRIPLST